MDFAISVNEYKKVSDCYTPLLFEDLPRTINDIPFPPKLYKYLRDNYDIQKKLNPYGKFFRRLILNKCPLTIMSIIEHIEERFSHFSINDNGDMSCVYCPRQNMLILDANSTVGHNPKYIIDVGKTKMKYRS